MMSLAVGVPGNGRREPNDQRPVSKHTFKETVDVKVRFINASLLTEGVALERK